MPGLNILSTLFITLLALITLTTASPLSIPTNAIGPLSHIDTTKRGTTAYPLRCNNNSLQPLHIAQCWKKFDLPEAGTTFTTWGRGMHLCPGDNSQEKPVGGVYVTGRAWGDLQGKRASARGAEIEKAILRIMSE